MDANITKTKARGQGCAVLGSMMTMGGLPIANSTPSEVGESDDAADSDSADSIDEYDVFDVLEPRDGDCLIRPSTSADPKPLPAPPPAPPPPGVAPPPPPSTELATSESIETSRLLDGGGVPGPDVLLPGPGGSESGETLSLEPLAKDRASLFGD
eukprot:SAG22_NODE_5471_length_1008_cov_0.778878_2_plen_154_part_01